jgi:hypothetical protein
METSLFKEGFDDASAWSLPHSGNEWMTEYMKGWNAGAASQMREVPAPYCDVRLLE